MQLDGLRSELVGYVRATGAQHSVVEDVVQEAVTRAWARIGDLQDPARLRPWVFRIAHNLVVDRVRRNREVSADLVPEQVETRWQRSSYTVDAFEVVARAETVAQVREALLLLPMMYRSVVVLHDAYGWTNAQVAEMFDLSLPATKQRLRRGRMMLVTALAQGAERQVPQAVGGCWEVRSKVSALLDGELDEQVQGQLRQHLEHCPTCPPLYAALAAARGTVAGLV